MMVMMGQSNRIWHYWAGRFPGSVGVMIGPSYGKRVPIDPWMPFALDNDAFKSWVTKTEWNFSEWMKMCEWVKSTGFKPMWAIAPDVVGDRVATIERYKSHSGFIKSFGWQIAFAVQDGMTPDDVPVDADVVFVGGTDRWKMRNLRMWTTNFERVHCGRVNSIRSIERCEQLGCESVDGTGYFRDPSRQDKIPALTRFIEGFRTIQDQPMLLE